MLSFVSSLIIVYEPHYFYLPISSFELPVVITKKGADGSAFIFWGTCRFQLHRIKLVALFEVTSRFVFLASDRYMGRKHTAGVVQEVSRNKTSSIHGGNRSKDDNRTGPR